MQGSGFKVQSFRFRVTGRWKSLKLGVLVVLA